MRAAHKALLAFLVVLLIATVYGLIRTGSQPSSNAPQQVLVDQTPLLTAQALAHLPTTPAEQPYAQQALALGDQEMDMAFSQALLDATQNPPVLTAQAKQIQAQLQSAEDAVAAQQAQVDQLTAADAKASGARKDALDDQLELAKAQLDLRQDEVDDAKEDLDRAGGDTQARIEAMMQQHQAASQSSDSTKIDVSVPPSAHGLVELFGQWWTLHQKHLALRSAEQGALSTAKSLSARHDDLVQQTAPPAPAPAPPASPANGGKKPAVAPENPTHEESAAMVLSTMRRAADRKTLVALAKRVDNEKQLASVYGQWINAVAAEQSTLTNGGLRTLLVILAIATIGLFLDDWIGNLLTKRSMDRRQTETLRATTRVTLQVVGALLVLIVIFGPPTQIGTILGLAGAGLTVALKDFIIGFLGWFVLMGKNGIRLGDWVEINGVTGEVVELGMFHTVLLETGNWADSGHPTGRRVTFTNSYAVEGHYFNFSTSGQWLWDELQIVLPSGQNPYPIVEAIEKKVVEVTAESARQAQEELQGAAKTRDFSAISAAPAINVKPVAGGTEIAVRYITRAHERADLRAKLNRAAVDLLGSPGIVQPDPVAAKPQPN